MTTDDIGDLAFVLQYLDFAHRRAGSRVVRQRAGVLLAMIRYLDKVQPGWWAAVLKEARADNPNMKVSDLIKSRVLAWGPDSILARALERAASVETTNPKEQP